MAIPAHSDLKFQIYFSEFLLYKRPPQPIENLFALLHTQATFLFSNSDLGFDSWFLLACVAKPASLACSTPCLGS